MNIRNVLKTYGMLRQLSDDETALLNTLRGLSDSDREQLVESLAPQAKPKPRKKREAKSARASSLQQQIANAATGQVNVELCGICGNEAGYQDHFKPSPNYHPFASSSSARSAAGGLSSKNGSQIESEASTEGDEASVSSAVGG